MIRAICSLVCAAGVIAHAFARTSAEQSSRDSGPGFDVASVRPVDTATREALASRLVQLVNEHSSSSLTLEPGGHWFVRSSPLRSILRSVYPAYSGRGQIVGGPSWVDSQLFEIDARAPEHSTTEDLERMARRLLADRFKIQLRTAMRPLDVYALSVIRDDKRLGRGVSPPIDCEQKPTLGPSGLPIPTARPRCQLMLRTEGAVQLLSGGAARMSELITWLQLKSDRPIVDRTGLTDEFAIRFEVPSAKPLSPAAQGILPATTSEIFTAVREQLGLNLVPRTESTTILVIEHVEMPVPN